MDDNISKLFKDVKRKALENWLAELPAFKFRDGRAKQVWSEYLAGCTDPHKKQVANFVATWANLIDRDYNSGSDPTIEYAVKNLNSAAEPPRYAGSLERALIMVEYAKDKAVYSGITSQILYNAVNLMKQVSIWGELVAKWEETREPPI